MTGTSNAAAASHRSLAGLTFLMFLMFAMTSDAVGTVIPRLIADYGLSMKAASAFHYVPMAAIALGAILFGFLADRWGRKATILAGLALYGFSSLLFAFGDQFGFFVVLLAGAGIGISVFKIGAIALIGDIARDSNEHTSLMNASEGFFGVGAMIGPAIVGWLLGAGLSWKYLYVVAAAMCGLLIVIALLVRYPRVVHVRTEPITLTRTLSMMRDPLALMFSALIMLYVAVEVAIYVWMPTYLQSAGKDVGMAAYALTAFFVLRAGGRFLGAWLLRLWRWQWVLSLFGLAIFLCFAASLHWGTEAGMWLLPLSGLFMSVMYPTLNSKGISCFAVEQHGAVAGVILFFTACAAALGPWLMAAVSDALGGIRYGFMLATGFALLLFVGLAANGLFNPAQGRLLSMDRNREQLRAEDISTP